MKKYIIYILLLAGSCVCINHINNITLQQIEKLEEIQNTITEKELQYELLYCLNENLKTGELCTTKK